MSDLLNLPSTLMQTIAAIFGIFIAILILAIQSMNTYKKDIESKIIGKEERNEFNTKFNQTIDSFEKAFAFMTFVVFIVEASYAIIVYFLSNSIFAGFYTLTISMYIGFISILMAFVVYTYYMISFSTSLVKNKPKYYNVTEFDFIYKFKFNFCNVIAFFAINFICIAMYFYLVNKFDSPVISSLGFCVISGLAIWFSFHGKMLKSATMFIIDIIYILLLILSIKVNGFGICV